MRFQFFPKFLQGQLSLILSAPEDLHFPKELSEGVRLISTIKILGLNPRFLRKDEPAASHSFPDPILYFFISSLSFGQ